MSLSLRRAEERDAAAIAAIYAPYVENTAISFEEVAPTPQQIAARMNGGEFVYPWIAACDGSDVVGYAYSSRHRDRASYRWSVDVTVYLDGRRHRRGIGRALYTALLQALTEMGFARAYAGITLPNAASVGLHESMGFAPVGVYEAVGYKMGAWRDVGWWARPLSAPTAEPQEPIALAALVASGRWQQCIDSGGALLR